MRELTINQRLHKFKDCIDAELFKRVPELEEWEKIDLIMRENNYKRKIRSARIERGEI